MNKVQEKEALCSGHFPKLSVIYTDGEYQNVNKGWMLKLESKLIIGISSVEVKERRVTEPEKRIQLKKKYPQLLELHMMYGGGGWDFDPFIFI